MSEQCSKCHGSGEIPVFNNFKLVCDCLELPTPEEDDEAFEGSPQSVRDKALLKAEKCIAVTRLLLGDDFTDAPAGTEKEKLHEDVAVVLMSLEDSLIDQVRDQLLEAAKEEYGVANLMEVLYAVDEATQGIE